MAPTKRELRSRDRNGSHWLPRQAPPHARARRLGRGARGRPRLSRARRSMARGEARSRENPAVARTHATVAAAQAPSRLAQAPLRLARPASPAVAVAARLARPTRYSTAQRRAATSRARTSRTVARARLELVDGEHDCVDAALAATRRPAWQDEARVAEAARKGRAACVEGKSTEEARGRVTDHGELVEQARHSRRTLKALLVRRRAAVRSTARAHAGGRAEPTKLVPERQPVAYPKPEVVSRPDPSFRIDRRRPR